jgi:hypothetical protein
MAEPYLNLAAALVLAAVLYLVVTHGTPSFEKRMRIYFKEPIKQWPKIFLGSRFVFTIGILTLTVTSVLVAETHFYSWTVGFTAILAYVICDCVLALLVERADDHHYQMPFTRVSLDSRLRMFFILFAVTLYGSLFAAVGAAEALAALVLPQPWASQNLIGIEGTLIAMLAIYFDVVVVYPRTSTRARRRRVTT